MRNSSIFGGWNFVKWPQPLKFFGAVLYRTKTNCQFFLLYFFSSQNISKNTPKNGSKISQLSAFNCILSTVCASVENPLENCVFFSVYEAFPYKGVFSKFSPWIFTHLKASQVTNFWLCRKPESWNFPLVRFHGDLIVIFRVKSLNEKWISGMSGRRKPNLKITMAAEAPPPV